MTRSDHRAGPDPDSLAHDAWDWTDAPVAVAGQASVERGLGAHGRWRPSWHAACACPSDCPRDHQAD